MIFETITITASHVYGYSMIFLMYLTAFYGPICHFKVVLAHILGEVGTFYTVLLNVSFRTCLPIIIDIGSYSA